MERWEMPMRRVVGILVAVVCVPMLAQVLLALLYWSPVLSGPEDTPCDPAVDGWGACWRLEQLVWWIVAALATLGGAVSMVMALRGFRRPGRWWPWLYASMGLLIAATVAAVNIS
ncbi:hypothetical protein JIG36_04595 [Actinoplanes sp. LDG1-06]|uniref:Transmembrane protein n=1 Tax=Paractinoplanes ovalisporus TaxID=2810368 RepID=A0ABS2A4R0_9ACTN|nr:hypothetical protein [Actinoplanes ovalisporus]MBM2614835.1 hypothetical protein [Actinoplanes ovalisporus]